MARIPFKQRSAPVKGKLQDFFDSVGANLRRNQKERGVFSKDGKDEKADREPGESKYQADVRRGRSKEPTEPTVSLDTKVSEDLDLSKTDTGPDKPSNKKKPTEKTPKKTKLTRKQQYDAKNWKYDDTIKGYNRDGSIKTKYGSVEEILKDAGINTHHYVKDKPTAPTTPTATPGDKDMPISSSGLSKDNKPVIGKWYSFEGGKVKQFDGKRYV